MQQLNVSVFAELNSHFFPQTLYLFQRIQYNEHTYTPHPQPITCLRALRDFTILGAIPRHLMNLKCKFQSMWGFLQIVIWKYFFNTQEFKCHVLLLCLKWQSHLTYKLTSRTQRQKCQDRDVLALSKKHTWKCEWTALNAGMAMSSKENKKETFLTTWINKAVFKPPWWVGLITWRAN